MQFQHMIDKVVDCYRILEIVGQGGMGIVFKARDEKLDRLVALKMMNPFLTTDPTFEKRFYAEAQSQAVLEHPNIVRVYAYLESEHGHFIVMEYVEGTTLADFVKENGRVAWPEAVRIFERCSRATGYAHDNKVVHRDIKPRNILLTDLLQPKLTDFGLAKIQNRHTQTVSSGQGKGTLFYMSPEQVLGRKTDQRSDLYSLGMTFYEVLTGHAPFEDGSSDYLIAREIVEKEFSPPGSLFDDIPEALSGIVMKLIAKQPGSRYQKAADILSDLEKLEDESSSPEPLPFQTGRSSTPADGTLTHTVVPVIEVSRRGSRKTHKVWPMAAVVLLLGSLIIAFLWMRLAAPVAPSADAEDIFGAVHRAYLTVTTVPPGVAIEVDGVLAGESPSELIVNNPGPFDLRLSREGYATIDTSLRIHSGDTLAFHSELWASIPQVSFPPSHPQEGQPAAGSRDMSDTPKKPAMGSVNILVRPWGRIYIDNQLVVEETNYIYETRLSTGVHLIRAGHPLLGEKEETITVSADTPVNLRFDLGGDR